MTAKVRLNYVAAKRRKWKKNLITLITVAVALELFRIDLSLMVFTTADKLNSSLFGCSDADIDPLIGMEESGGEESPLCLPSHKHAVGFRNF